MTDWNRNGIPDDKERKKLPTASGPYGATSWADVQPQVANPGALGSTYAIQGTTAKGLKAKADKAKSEMWTGTLKAPTEDWWNYTDFADGVQRTGNRYPQAREEAPAEKSLSDYINDAIALIGQYGGGGGAVNYDPQRATLRQNASENDARLEAMYRQLRGSIDADAPVIQKAYQDALDSTASHTATAQAQTQAAADSATARNDSVLANLGIQQAAGNQILEGRDLASQTAQSIAGQAAKGQAAQDLLSTGQATALAHNTNIGNAAGLEGNLQRASNNARLQALLADIDMQEQQQNAARQGNNFSQQLSLAQSLLGFDQDKQAREDQLQMSAAELAQKQASAYDPNRFMAWLIDQGIGLPDNKEDPYNYAKTLDLYRKIYTG